jgi:KipI family sensor histidine kinase inhibitor
MRVRAAGDAALLVQAEGLAHRLAAAITLARISGVLDVVPGASTVLVITEPGRLDLDELAARLLALPLPAASPAASALTEIPVVYDGPDLAEVARLTGLSADEVVARHLAREYTVGWLGFSPGFGYLTGLDPVLATVPRLAEPRLRVPAGAVAIAGGLAAVYSSTSPGGWRLLGRTSAVLWDPDREPPAVFAPGMKVRFRQADPATPRPAEIHDRGGLTTNMVINQPRSWIGGSAIEVIKPGPLATVQDLGRSGFGHLGVPHSGAADPASLRRANRLAGNPDGAAALELTLGRAEFRFLGQAWVAVAGAPAVVTLHGPDAAADSTDGATPSGAAFAVPPGGVVRVGSPAAGLRTYLAVRGGIDVPPVLGSRSADLRSGLGPAPLRAGDVLPIGAAAEPTPGEPGPAGGLGPADEQGPAGNPGRADEPDPAGNPGRAREPDPAGNPGPASNPGRADEPGPAGGLGPADGAGAALPAAAGQPTVLRVIPGPRDDWFAPGALNVLCGSTYTVTTASDRTGLRLDGPAPPRARDGELPSEGVVAGSIQVPPGGRPILLLADHPVTGGYPVIAVVVSADVGLAGQLRPGSKLRFTLASRAR